MSESLFDLPGDGAHLNTRIPLAAAATSAPLAVRMRPGSIEEVVGQAHLLSTGSPLRRLVEGTGAASVILYGPPGTGKSALAAFTMKLFEVPKWNLTMKNGVDLNVDAMREIAAANQQQFPEIPF